MGRLEDLVAAQHRRYVQLQLRAAQLAGHAWDEFGGPGDDDYLRLVNAVTPIAVAARQQTADLMAGYLSLVVRSAVPIDIRGVLDRIRGGTAIAEVYGRPVVTTRTMLSEGRSLDDAIAGGRDRVVSTARTDVILANREAAVDGMSGSDRIRGYRRVPTAGSCPYCVGAAGDEYATDQLMPIHNNCDCGIAPIVGGHDPGRVLNRSLPELGPDAPTAAVHDHGELGPVLGDADHDFTGPHDIAA